jgi:hypothetical protein
MKNITVSRASSTLMIRDCDVERASGVRLFVSERCAISLTTAIQQSATASSSKREFAQRGTRTLHGMV